MVRSVYRASVKKRKALLMAFSLRNERQKAKGKHTGSMASPVPQAEGHQQKKTYTFAGIVPHSGHTTPAARPVRS